MKKVISFLCAVSVMFSASAFSADVSAKERSELIASLTEEMKNAAKMLEFEHAAYLRDKIKELKGE